MCKYWLTVNLSKVPVHFTISQCSIGVTSHASGSLHQWKSNRFSRVYYFEGESALGLISMPTKFSQLHHSRGWLNLVPFYPIWRKIVSSTLNQLRYGDNTLSETACHISLAALSHWTSDCVHEHTNIDVRICLWPCKNKEPSAQVGPVHIIASKAKIADRSKNMVTQKLCL